jgi:hypothetical protein
MDKMPLAEKPAVPSRYAAIFKYAAFLGGLMALPGGMSLMIQQEISQKEELAAIFSRTADHVTYRLEGAHVVVAEYGSARYAYNFKDKNVFATWPSDDRPGGGLTSFRGIDNPGRIDEARAQGCLVAAQAVKAANPGHYTADTFPAKQEEAAAFTRAYCPQIP